jgi:hypothetical protein
MEGKDSLCYVLYHQREAIEERIGGGYRTRTGDLLHAMQTL